MTRFLSTRFSRVPARRTVAASSVTAALLALSACGSLDGIADNRIDYRGSKAKSTSLEVPPDLTQLSAEGRYQPQSGPVTASAFQSSAATPAPATGPTAAAAPAAAGTTSTAVATRAAGDFRVERSGDVRWLATSLTPEQLWPQLQAFFSERGLALTVDQPQIGLMETAWAENRAKLQQDLLRRTLGRVLDPLYSTGERDMFRLRIERVAGGSEVYLTHRGMEEVYQGSNRESTAWQFRPRDPLLEAEMLSRIMVRLGAPAEQAKALEAEAAAKPAAAAAAAAAPPARARVLSGRPTATLQVDDGFDRAWRRVGLALDRSGFTVEDRDRAQGVYFVRYVDPAQAGKEEPGFFSRLFSRKTGPTGPVRYRVTVKPEGEATVVSIFNAEGAPETGEAGQRIVSSLLQDLK